MEFAFGAREVARRIERSSRYSKGCGRAPVLRSELTSNFGQFPLSVFTTTIAHCIEYFVPSALL